MSVFPEEIVRKARELLTEIRNRYQRDFEAEAAPLMKIIVDFERRRMPEMIIPADSLTKKVVVDG